MTQLLDHLQIRPAIDLGLVVLGRWNTQSCAKSQFAQGDRQAVGLYPLPQLGEDYHDTNGDWHEYSRCGGGFDVPNNTELLDRLTVPWTTDAILDYLDKRNFTGTLMVGTQLENIRGTKRTDMGFAIHPSPNVQQKCIVPNCTRNPGQHSCMPGEPFLFVKDLAI